MIDRESQCIQFLRNKKRILLTGGAGFIGSHIANMLAGTQTELVIYDNLSSGKIEYLREAVKFANVTFIQGDILDGSKLTAAIQGCDLIWHLASNTDIIGSHLNPSRDVSDGISGTFNILEAMRERNISDIIFSSSGAVYGNSCDEKTVSENIGPLKPVSTYGAAKLSAEALISSYCHVYGLRAWIYRFGNVLGARMTHGVIVDFVGRLMNDPTRLLILGDGRQEKNYFLVEECIHGMLYGFDAIELDENMPCSILNLGTSSVTKIIDLAKIVINEMGLTGIPIEIEGNSKAWPGDQPRVHFSVDAMRRIGWTTKLESDASVEVAVKRVLLKDKFNS